MRAVSALLLVLLFAAPLWAQTAAPSPALTPTEVVRIQLDALRQNDQPYPDAGIETTFSFASTGNQIVTGPVERFGRMIKGGYAVMLDHERAEYDNAVIQDSRAGVRVTLYTAQGAPSTFLFLLSKQTVEPYEDCWMVDSVVEDERPAYERGAVTRI